MSSLIYVRDTSSNKNVPLEVDSSNNLSVSDATSHTTLSSISSSLSGTLSTSDTTAQSSLSAIESSVAGTLSVNDMSASTTLSSIDTSLSGTLATSDATAQSTLSSIDTSLSGTLLTSDMTAQSTLSSINTALAGTITTSQGVSRTNGNIAVSSSVSNGDVSSSVDANNYKHVIVFGNLGASGDVLIQVSNDNSNWYEDSNSQFWSNSSVYDVAGRFEATARYWRVKYGVSGTITLRYALSS